MITTLHTIQNVKLNKQQANHLQRLFTACGNAKNFNEGCIRSERLDKYMDHLMEQGIDIKEINDLLY